jgi:hypothetical protein
MRIYNIFACKRASGLQFQSERSALGILRWSLTTSEDAIYKTAALKRLFAPDILKEIQRALLSG